MSERVNLGKELPHIYQSVLEVDRLAEAPLTCGHAPRRVVHNSPNAPAQRWKPRSRQGQTSDTECYPPSPFG